MSAPGEMDEETNVSSTCALCAGLVGRQEVFVVRVVIGLVAVH